MTKLQELYKENLSKLEGKYTKKVREATLETFNQVETGYKEWGSGKQILFFLDQEVWEKEMVYWSTVARILTNEENIDAIVNYSELEDLENAPIGCEQIAVLENYTTSQDPEPLRMGVTNDPADKFIQRWGGGIMCPLKEATHMVTYTTDEDTLEVTEVTLTPFESETVDDKIHELVEMFKSTYTK